MEVEPSRVTSPAVRAMLEELIVVDPEAGYVYPEEGRVAQVDNVLRGSGMAKVTYSWKRFNRRPPMDSLPFESQMQRVLATRNDGVRPDAGTLDIVRFGATVNGPKLAWDTKHTILGLLAYESDIPTSDHEKVAFVLPKIKAACNAVQPLFAAIDHFGKRIWKHRGEDLRRHAWGAALYGPDLVRMIGREKLLSVPAWGVEELDWGGIWVQASENPFVVTSAAMKPIEAGLNLNAISQL